MPNGGDHATAVKDSVRRFFQKSDPDDKGFVSEERLRAFFRFQLKFIFLFLLRSITLYSFIAIFVIDVVGCKIHCLQVSCEVLLRSCESQMQSPRMKRGLIMKSIDNFNVNSIDPIKRF